MPDENNESGNTNNQQVDVSALTNQVTDLTKQLETANNLIESLKGDKQKLSGEIGSLKKANNQMHAQVSDLQGQIGQLTNDLETKGGEATNLKTQVDQLTGQVQGLTKTNGELSRDMSIWNIVAETPDLHGKVGEIPTLAKIISADADPELIKQHLLSSAQAGQQQQQQAAQEAVQTFAAGGTPPSPPGNTQPGNNDAPVTVESIHQRMQMIDPNLNPAEYGKLHGQLLDLQDQQRNGQQQPA